MADETKKSASANEAPVKDSKASTPASANEPPVKGPEPEKESEKKPSKSFKVKNEAMAGKTTHGISKKAIVFDEKGIAEVDEAEFEHLANVPGYEEA